MKPLSNSDRSLVMVMTVGAITCAIITASAYGLYMADWGFIVLFFLIGLLAWWSYPRFDWDKP